MRRETANVLLVLVGGALTKIALDGTAVRYVKPSLVPWLVVSGVVVLVLAVVSIVRDVRGRAAVEEHEGHGAVGARSPWLLVLPVLVILLLAPPALGASSVSGDTGGRSVATASGASSQTFPALPPGADPAVRLSDFVQRAVWDHSGALELREVSLTGFVVHRPAGSTQLGRMVISCCAADALPVLVDLRTDGPGTTGTPLSALPVNTWITVRATLVGGSATPANGYLPTAVVTSWTQVTAPADAYET